MTTEEMYEEVDLAYVQDLISKEEWEKVRAAIGATEEDRQLPTVQHSGVFQIGTVSHA